MNRQEAKKLLPFIQALAEGKPIQLKDRIGNWMDVDFINVELCNSNVYRIKPEPKYRPFKNKEECWQEMLKHEPFGWLKDNEANEYFNVECIASGNKAIDLYTNSFKRCVFIDGTPFGVKEQK